MTKKILIIVGLFLLSVSIHNIQQNPNLLAKFSPTTKQRTIYYNCNTSNGTCTASYTYISGKSYSDINSCKNNCKKPQKYYKCNESTGSCTSTYTYEAGKTYNSEADCKNSCTKKKLYYNCSADATIAQCASSYTYIAGQSYDTAAECNSKCKIQKKYYQCDTSSNKCFITTTRSSNTYEIEKDCLERCAPEKLTVFTCDTSDFKCKGVEGYKDLTKCKDNCKSSGDGCSPVFVTGKGYTCGWDRYCVGNVCTCKNYTGVKEYSRYNSQANCEKSLLSDLEADLAAGDIKVE